MIVDESQNTTHFSSIEEHMPLAIGPHNRVKHMASNVQPSISCLIRTLDDPIQTNSEFPSPVKETKKGQWTYMQH